MLKDLWIKFNSLMMNILLLTSLDPLDLLADSKGKMLKNSRTMPIWLILKSLKKLLQLSSKELRSSLKLTKRFQDLPGSHLFLTTLIKPSTSNKMKTYLIKSLRHYIRIYQLELRSLCSNLFKLKISFKTQARSLLSWWKNSKQTTRKNLRMLLTISS